MADRAGIGLLLAAVLALGCFGPEPKQPAGNGSAERAVAIENLEKQVSGLAARVEELARTQEELVRKVEEGKEKLKRLREVEIRTDQVRSDLKKLVAEIKEDRADGLAKEKRELPAFAAEALPPEPAPDNPAAGKPEEKKPGEDGAPGGPAAEGAETGTAVDGAPADASTLPPAEMSLLEVRFAPSVDRKKREPEGPKEQFTLADQTVYCYIVFLNKSKADGQVTLTWKKGARKITGQPMRVGAGSRRWRTWSYIRLTPEMVGKWEVEVHDAAGNLLGTGSFSLTK